MNYNSYEEYMRDVLGYAPNTYNDEKYYGANLQWTNPLNLQNTFEEKQEWYPEIYKMVYPMVCKACDDNQNLEVTKDLIENITNTIYTNFDVEETNARENSNQQVQSELRNGDVINPRAKQQIRETRSFKDTNSFLRDLIKILVLREFFDRRRPPIRTFPNKPGPGPIPGMRPPRYY